jgi:hypothetical protein
MLVSMNISDLLGQGNPDGEEEVLWLGEEPNTQNKASKQAKLSKNTLIILGIVVLSSVASLSFGLLTAGQGTGSGGLIVSSIPMTHPTSSLITASVVSATSATSSGAIPSGREIVGDKSTHAYYLPWCTQVGKISKVNAVWFATEQAAKSAGYTAGKACSGI